MRADRAHQQGVAVGRRLRDLGGAGVAAGAGLLSTTNGCPNARCSSGASARATMSVVPPAANGTTMRTGRAGQDCARASDAPASAASDATAWRRETNEGGMQRLRMRRGRARYSERGDAQTV
jgi:hypothetical protein